jgi:hypothetical protein
MDAVIKVLHRFLTSLTAKKPPKYVIVFRMALKIEVRSLQNLIG